MTLIDDAKIISCRICGIIMVKLVRDVCPECFQQEEKDFQIVRDFLRANKGASLEDVAKHTKCKLELVETFVRSGRLERVGVRKIPHPCQLCKEIIDEGVVCLNCKKELKEQVDQLKLAFAEENPKKDAPKSSEDSKDAPASGRKNKGNSGHVGKRAK